MRRLTTTLLSILISASTSALAAPSAPLQEPDPFELVPAKVVGISKKTGIRVAYDVKDDVQEAGIGKALYYVRGLLEAYKSLGVPDKQLKISVVLHGATVYWALNEESYRQHKNDPFDFNPNIQVLRELAEHGVSVEICNSTLKGKGWIAADLLPGMVIVHDAYTRLIDLQHQGYAYIRF